MFAILVRAEANFFEGFGLRGFIHVHIDDSMRVYTLSFPTTEDPSPPGWATIEQLSGVTAAEVIASWSEDYRANAAAERAMAQAHVLYQGLRLMVESETPLEHGKAIEMAPLRVDAAAPKRILRQEENAESPPEVEPAYRTAWDRVFVESRTPGNHAWLVISIPAIDAATWPRFQVPDETDHTPADWWFVEVFTNISHLRVAESWGQQGNPALEDTVFALSRALQGLDVPILAGGQPDLQRFRHDAVRKRYHVDNKLPFLFLGRPLHDVAHTRALLKDTVGEFLFVVNAEPGKTRGQPAMILPVKGVPALEVLSDDNTPNLLTRFINFTRPGRPPKYGYPSDKLVNDLLHFPDPAWPALDGVTRIPVLRPDGTVLTTPGYDAQSRLWYAPEFELEPIPETITRADVMGAKTLIAAPIDDFPFVADSDRAAALASLLEQVVRPMIRGSRPLYIFDAPTPGSGKTLLAKIFQVIISGKDPVISALGRREEEIEKRLVSYLRELAPYIILDNLTGTIDSPALQQLATSERFQARLLGGNEAPQLPQNATWVMTLNKAKCNEDVMRRSVLVRLDAKMERPWDRTGFKIKDPISWSLERRASIVRALLILARSWVLAGMPADPDLRRGSFERWVQVVGGIMYHAGFKGLSKAVKEIEDREVNAEDHRFLVKIWVNDKQCLPMPAYELGFLAKEHGLYEPILGKKTKSLAVGRAMRDVVHKLVGQVIEGHRIDEAPSKTNGYTMYTVTPAN